MPLRGDPMITTIIVNECLIRHSQTVNPIRYPRRYHKLIQHQNKIGWNQVLCGRVTKTFVQHHDHFSTLNKTTCNGEQWMTKVIANIWGYVRSVWQHRNNVFHDETQKSEEYRKHIQDQVRSLYENEKYIDPCDRHALSAPQDQVLQYGTSNMEKWLTRVRPKVQAAIKRTKV